MLVTRFTRVRIEKSGYNEYMPDYIVSGVDKSSGNDFERMVEAATLENARAKVEITGAVVTDVRETQKILNRRFIPEAGTTDGKVATGVARGILWLIGGFALIMLLMIIANR